MISYDDFSKLELRVGKVLEASEHPNADKLLLLKVDLGDRQVQLVAGIRQHYATQDLINKAVVVLANLEPRQLRGVESQGMVLAAHDQNGIKLLTIDGEVAVGSGIK